MPKYIKLVAMLIIQIHQLDDFQQHGQLLPRQLPPAGLQVWPISTYFFALRF